MFRLALILLCLASPALAFAQQQPPLPDGQYLYNACMAQLQRSQNSDTLDTAWQFQYLAARDAARAERDKALGELAALKASVPAYPIDPNL